MILSTLVQSWNWLCVKLMYIENPKMSGFQIMFGRSFCSIIVLLVFLNKDLKFVMFDSFPEGNQKLLAARICTGLVGISCMLHSNKWFSLSTIAIVTGLNPVFTTIGGVCYLKEKITKLDVFCILLSFLGVILMTVGLVVED